MSYKTPTIPTLTLKGIDKKIQEIQILMDADLSWVTKCFGLADRIVEWKEGEYVYPAVFESNTIDPVPMLPGDAWNAFSFWTKTGTAEFESNIDFAPKNPIVTYEVSCIFYADIRRIYPNDPYKESKSRLTEDIFNFFNKVKVKGRLIPIRFIDDDITKVWSGFTLDQVDNRFKMYPKWACRMDFELSFRDDCYNPRPILQSIVVEDATPAKITLTYDIDLNESYVPTLANYQVTGGVYTSIEVSDNTVIINLDPSLPITYGVSVGVSYYSSTSGGVALRGVNGGYAESFSDYAVTNNVLA